MKLSLVAFSLLASVVLAHTENDINLEDSDLSLPELATLNALNPPKWEITGDAEFVEGRIIMTPKANSVGILKNPIPLAYDSWTLETIFRSKGERGKTGGALALKYTKETGGAVYDSFDGLEVVVDSDGPLGGSIHAYINDGSYDLNKLEGKELYDHAFGSCLLTYQDADVPNTFRVSYYAGNLVIQINNRVCLKTQKVKLPADYKVSLVASSGSKHEQFEVLKLKTYGGVISEILENDGFPAPQPKIVTEFVEVTPQGDVIDKLQVDKETGTPLERIKFDSEILAIVEKIQSTNKDIIESFTGLESKVLALSATGQGGKADLLLIDEQNKKFKLLAASISSVSQDISALSGKFAGLESSIRQEVGKLVASVNKLSADNINELRENEHSIQELAGKIDYLVLSEKERAQNPVSDVINGLKYLILPVLIASLALCFFAYRLRHDIKTKLL